MSDFFAMGGYGAYIWPCYGVALILLLAILLDSLRRLKAREAMLNDLKDKEHTHEAQT